jgi:hypothetical protein
MDNDDGPKHALVDRDTPINRLLAHPRLPFIAGFDVRRPAIHIWRLGPGAPSHVAELGTEAEPYTPDRPWDDYARIPSASWHPQEPILALTAGGGVQLWSPSGVADLAPDQAAAEYRWVAFSPDGRTVWASPSAQADDDDPWGSADAIAVSSGARRTGLPMWDTGVATHPGSDLVLTLNSDQGATLGLFARVDETGDQAGMRLLTRALILDADGYETPLFSPDGRYFAIRGNAYDNSLQVFAFPELREVLAATLGRPSPGYPYPDDWLAEMQSWSRHNVAFGTRSGVRLLVGTPDGRIIDLDLETGTAAEHRVPWQRGVSGLAVSANGDVIIATDGAGVMMLHALGGGGPAEASARMTAARMAEAFLGSTTEVPAGVDVYEALETTDGRRTWTAPELDAVTDAASSDPTWLRMRASINALLLRRDEGDQGSQ